MTKSIRFALLVSVALGALVWAGSALASFAPKIYVKGAAAGTNIRVQAGATDDPTARFALYAPTGYTGNFAATPGTVLGPVTAHAQAADLGGAILPLTGSLVVANPVDPTIVAASNACDPVAHAAVWVLNLTAAGQTLPVPMFADAISGPEAALGAYKLVVCLPPPDLPPGTPGRATFGAKLLDADFTTSAITAPAAPGRFIWRGFWTPYKPLVGQVNAAGTVETESLWFQPTVLSIKTKVTSKKVAGHKRSTALVAGVLSAAGTGAPAQPIDILAGPSPTKLKKVKTVATGANGQYSFAMVIKSATFFQAKATSPDRDLGPSLCAPNPIPPAVPCISATVSGGTLSSSTAKAVPKR